MSKVEKYSPKKKEQEAVYYSLDMIKHSSIDSLNLKKFNHEKFVVSDDTDRIFLD